MFVDPLKAPCIPNMCYTLGVTLGMFTYPWLMEAALGQLTMVVSLRL